MPFHLTALEFQYLKKIWKSFKKQEKSYTIWFTKHFMMSKIHYWKTYLFFICYATKIHHLTHQYSSTAILDCVVISNFKVQIVIHIALIRLSSLNSSEPTTTSNFLYIRTYFKIPLAVNWHLVPWGYKVYRKVVSSRSVNNILIWDCYSKQNSQFCKNILKK